MPGFVTILNGEDLVQRSLSLRIPVAPTAKAKALYLVRTPKVGVTGRGCVSPGHHWQDTPPPLARELQDFSHCALILLCHCQQEAQNCQVIPHLLDSNSQCSGVVRTPPSTQGFLSPARPSHLPLFFLYRTFRHRK